MIHKSRVPEQGKRGRMFEQAITRLAEWWYSSFFEVESEGHIRSRTYDSVEALMNKYNPKGKEIEPDDLPDVLDDDGEVVRSEKSMMKHSLKGAGTRDMSAQLFTALCRALDIPARLVVSLQSVPWQAGVGKPKPKYAKKGKGKEKEVEVEVPSNGVVSTSSPVNGAFAGEGQRLDGAPVEKSEKAKGKEKAKPPITLRKTKNKSQKLGSATPDVPLDPTSYPPVFWTEVFSRPDGRWLPVDSVRAIVNNRRVFDPSSSLMPPGTPVWNRMVYVVALEEDGYGRDVTRRYAKNFGAKVAKVQGGSSSIGAGGRGRQAWWERVVGTVTRPYRLHRDDLEDAELDSAQIMEGMPTSISGFKDHPLYVLPRHLKQTETIYPPPPDTPELGKFRGEPVYPRSAIVPLKTAENWLRSEGRSVKEGVQPLKLIKVRAGTVGRMRELEVLKDTLKEAGDDGANEIMQGLYARSQTEPYTPDPVVDGRIPKNDFGNIDLYVPSMLPWGAVHVPFKGVAKVAKKLGFDYAEAVVGFEFRKRRATPVIEGVVVAQENEQALIEAFLASEEESLEKARIKKEERVLKRWTRLIHGLRIRKRLQEQYADRGEKDPDEHPEKEQHEHGHEPEGGGFLVEADDVVQAYHLPKDQIVHRQKDEDPPVAGPSRIIDDDEVEVEEEEERPVLDFRTIDVDEGDDDDIDMEEVHVPIVGNGALPKSMRALAEEAGAGRTLVNGNEDAVEELADMTPAQEEPPAPAPSPRKVTLKMGPGKPALTPTRKSSRKRQRKEEVSDQESKPSPPSKKPRVRKSAPAVVEAPSRTLRPRKSRISMREADDDED